MPLPEGWVPTDPHTWEFETYITADHRDLMTRAVDYFALDNWERDPATDHLVLTTGATPEEEAAWWFGVLSSIHAADVAVAQASDDAIAQAVARLGIVNGESLRDFQHSDTDLETTAARSDEITAVLAQSAA